MRLKSLSANAATSVCLYRKQEKPLRCRPIIRPSPTLPYRRSRRRSHRVPSLCFFMPWRLRPAVSCAYWPATSNGGTGDSPAHCSAIALPWSCSPVPSPGRFVTFREHHHRLCRLSAGGNGVPASGAGRRSPPLAHLPAIQRSNSDHAGKRYVLGRNRVSIETQDCHSRHRNAISRELTSLINTMHLSF